MSVINDIDLTPITRLEYDIDAIINDHSVIDPVTRIEQMLSDIKGGTPTAVEPVTRIETFLANISGVDIALPEPVTRIETFLAIIAGGDYEAPEPATRLEGLLAEWVEKGSDIWKTVTGTLIHITDALASPVKELSVAIEPYQNLTYGDPYPAGCSNNLIPDGTDTSKGYQANKRLNADGTTTNDEYFYISEYFTITAEETYTFSNKLGTAANPSLCFYDENKEYISGVNFGGVSPQVITAPANAVYCRANQYYRDKGNIVQLELGSTPTTIKPYSNICPITGWTGCEVIVHGVNFYDGEWENGNISDSTGQNSGSSSSYFRSKNYCRIPPNTDLYWYSPSRSGNFRQYFYDKDFNYLGHTEKGWNRVISVTSYDWAKNIAYFRFRVSASYSEASDSKISINYPATVTEYVPYAGTTTPISWQTEAGTVYYADYDAVSGVLKNYDSTNNSLITIDGTGWTQTTVSSKTTFQHSHPSGAYNQMPFISNYLKQVESFSGNIPKNVAYFGSSKFNVYCPDLTLAEWTALLNETPLQIIRTWHNDSYTEYNLGENDISTLVGENNIWADVNGEITLTYLSVPETAFSDNADTGMADYMTLTE